MANWMEKVGERRSGSLPVFTVRGWGHTATAGDMRETMAMPRSAIIMVETKCRQG